MLQQPKQFAKRETLIHTYIYIHTYTHTLYFNSNLQSSSNNELISSSM
jgi:hypothetical protein